MVMAQDFARKMEANREKSPANKPISLFVPAK
jgi:hypothetical protein